MFAIQLGVFSCAYRLIYLIVKSIYYIVYKCVFVLGIMYNVSVLQYDLHILYYCSILY